VHHGDGVCTGVCTVENGGDSAVRALTALKSIRVELFPKLGVYLCARVYDKTERETGTKRERERERECEEAVMLGGRSETERERVRPEKDDDGVLQEAF
jgi:hypothetical protein